LAAAMTEVGLVLDTSAALAYTKGLLAPGWQIARASAHSLTVLLPALCLAEAYRRVEDDGWNLLSVLEDLPHVEVAPVERGLCLFLGGWSRTLGAMDLAHAAIEAAGRPMVPFMTAHRDEVSKVLPREWPILDPYAKPE
jgi:hypothetical protein